MRSNYPRMFLAGFCAALAAVDIRDGDMGNAAISIFATLCWIGVVWMREMDA